MKRFYSYVAAMQEVTMILGGKPEKATYEGKTETYRRGNKAVKIDRELLFDDDGFNKYDLMEVSA